MKTILFVIIPLLVFASCSTDVTKIADKNNVEQPQLKSDKAKEEALTHMINASVFELQGKYAEAVLEYQDALELDPQPGIYYSLGKTYLRLNKLSPALKNSKTAVESEPNNIEYKFLLANIYQMANQLDSAANVYSNIISLDSSNVQAHFNLAMIYEKSRPIQALELYKKVLELTGPQWELLVKIADLNERMGKIEETIKTVEELYALNPSSLDLQKILIESYIKTGNYTKASALLEEALILFPDDLNLIELKGQNAILQGNWVEGANEYHKLIQGDKIPFDSKIKIGLAFLAQAEQDTINWSLAKNIFDTIDHDSTDWQVKSYLGEIAIHYENDSLAIEYFKKASELAGWNAPVWIRLGGLLFDNGKYQDAVLEMEKVISHFPDEYAINLILGLSYSQLNRNEDAEQYLRKAVSLNPNDLNAIAAFGFTLNQLGKDDEAIIYLKKALKIDPNHADLLGMLGLIYDNKAMFEECDEAYEKAIQIDPNNATVLNNYAYSLAERGIELERALEMSKNAVGQEPENPSFLDTIGWIYFKLGDLIKAKIYIEDAIDRDKNDDALLDHLGDVYLKMGEKEKALEFWKKSLELNKGNEVLKQKIEKGDL